MRYGSCSIQKSSNIILKLIMKCNMNEDKKPTAHHENDRKAHPPTTNRKIPPSLPTGCIKYAYADVILT